jgi:hypothetical protein
MILGILRISKHIKNYFTQSIVCQILKYKNCRVSMGKQLYLSEDFNFEASRLKLLARTNCLSINATLFRMSLSDNDRCSVCPLHSVEEDL